MRYIVCAEPGKLVFGDKEMPSPQPAETLVKIERIGICGTDYHAYRGQQPFFVYPRILGHELSATVVEINGDSHGLSVGDPVAIMPYLHCGKCVACRRGQTNCCVEMRVLGVHQDGGMQEYLCVPTESLLKADGIDLDAAAIVEPLGIGAHAVRRAQLTAADQVLVIGGGPIGLGVMKFAKLAGARVIAMDINEERLAFCRSWADVDGTIDARDQPLERLSALTGGDLATAVFDATGNAKSMAGAFDYAAHGGRVIYVGLVKADISFHDPDFHKKELTLLASRNATRDDLLGVLEQLRNGNIDAAAYTTHRADFEQLPEQFEQWLNPASGVIKAVVSLS